MAEGCRRATAAHVDRGRPGAPAPKPPAGQGTAASGARPRPGMSGPAAALPLAAACRRGPSPREARRRLGPVATGGVPAAVAERSVAPPVAKRSGLWDTRTCDAGHWLMGPAAVPRRRGGPAHSEAAVARAATASSGLGLAGIEVAARRGRRSEPTAPVESRWAPQLPGGTPDALREDHRDRQLHHARERRAAPPGGAAGRPPRAGL